MPREDVPEELVEIAARVLPTLYVDNGGTHPFRVVTRETSKEGVARAVLSAVSEAGWVRAEKFEIVSNNVRALYKQRNEARAQSEALAEALDLLLNGGVTLHGPIRPVTQPVVQHALREQADAALSAYRSSQESSDAS